MPRYSQLKPLCLSDKISICAKMLRLFGIDFELKKEAREFLKIIEESQVNRPFSLNDFMNFFSHKDKFDYHSIRAHILEIARKLEAEGFLSFAGNKGFSLGSEKCFHVGYELTKLQQKGALYLAKALGLELVYNVIKTNVAHITGLNKLDDVVGGSGILISNNIVLTCAHVISDMEKMDDTLLVNNSMYRILKKEFHKKIDVGFIEIENTKDIIVPDLSFSDGITLEKVAVLGYPPVPRSTHSVLVVQSGEVTGYINDISNNNYLLFSAIARPGNSGGPVVSEKGSILGIVSQEISHQDTPVFPFYSAVPTSEIIKALNDLNCPVELPIDTYE